MEIGSYLSGTLNCTKRCLEERDPRELGRQRRRPEKSWQAGRLYLLVVMDTITPSVSLISVTFRFLDANQ